MSVAVDIFKYRSVGPRAFSRFLIDAFFFFRIDPIFSHSFLSLFCASLCVSFDLFSLVLSFALFTFCHFNSFLRLFRFLKILSFSYLPVFCLYCFFSSTPSLHPLSFATVSMLLFFFLSLFLFCLSLSLSLFFSGTLQLFLIFSFPLLFSLLSCAVLRFFKVLFQFSFSFLPVSLISVFFNDFGFPIHLSVFHSHISIFFFKYVFPKFFCGFLFLSFPDISVSCFSTLFISISLFSISISRVSLFFFLLTTLFFGGLTFYVFAGFLMSSVFSFPPFFLFSFTLLQLSLSFVFSLSFSLFCILYILSDPFFFSLSHFFSLTLYFPRLFTSYSLCTFSLLCLFLISISIISLVYLSLYFFSNSFFYLLFYTFYIYSHHFYCFFYFSFLLFYSLSLSLSLSLPPFVFQPFFLSLQFFPSKIPFPVHLFHFRPPRSRRLFLRFQFVADCLTRRSSAACPP
jgi:hypothetical protein